MHTGCDSPHSTSASHIEAVTSDIEDATDHVEAVTSHTVPAIAHTAPDTIKPPFEPTVTNHEKMVKPF